MREKNLCEFKQYFGENFDKRPECDLAVFQRTSLSHLPLMKELKARGIPVVFDLDDDLPNLPRSNPANMIISPHREVAMEHYRAFLKNRGMAMVLKDLATYLALPDMETGDEKTRIQKATFKVGEMAIRNFNAVLESAKLADMLTVSTESLRKTYSGWGCKNVRVLSNQEKASEWRGVMKVPLLNRVVVGWAGGISHFFGDLQPLREPMGKILKLFPQVQFHLCGVPEIYKLFDNCPKDRVEIKQWTDWEEHKENVSEFDIQLAPLYGTPKFQRGKSDIRVLQGFMVGVPSVVTDMTYGQTIRDSNGGLIAETESEWVEQLSKLIADSDVRRQLGKNGKRYMETRTYEGHATEWFNAYQSLLEKR